MACSLHIFILLAKCSIQWRCHSLILSNDTVIIYHRLGVQQVGFPLALLIQNITFCETFSHCRNKLCVLGIFFSWPLNFLFHVLLRTFISPQFSGDLFLYLFLRRHRGNTGPMGWCRQCSLPPPNFGKVWQQFSFKCLVGFTGEAVRSPAFLCCKT